MEAEPECFLAALIGTGTVPLVRTAGSTPATPANSAEGREHPTGSGASIAQDSPPARGGDMERPRIGPLRERGHPAALPVDDDRSRRPHSAMVSE
jgi:hypothetical protein